MAFSAGSSIGPRSGSCTETATVARRRTVAWDPQVQKALGLVTKAELLLRDPQAFMAAREAEGRMAVADPSN